MSRRNDMQYATVQTEQFGEVSVAYVWQNTDIVIREATTTDGKYLPLNAETDAILTDAICEDIADLADSRV